MIGDDGKLYPFARDAAEVRDCHNQDEGDAQDCFGEGPCDLRDAYIIAWPGGGHDGGAGEHVPENTIVELVVFGGCEGYAAKCDLDDLLRAGFLDRNQCGDGAEVIALTKLRATIDALIAERSK